MPGGSDVLHEFELGGPSTIVREVSYTWDFHATLIKLKKKIFRSSDPKAQVKISHHLHVYHYFLKQMILSYDSERDKPIHVWYSDGVTGLFRFSLSCSFIINVQYINSNIWWRLIYKIFICHTEATDCCPTWTRYFDSETNSLRYVLTPYSHMLWFILYALYFYAVYTIRCLFICLL